jgi:hypothetical protein
MRISMRLQRKTVYLCYNENAHYYIGNPGANRSGFSPEKRIFFPERFPVLKDDPFKQRVYEPRTNLN